MKAPQHVLILAVAALVVACGKTYPPPTVEVPEGRFRIAMPATLQKVPIVFNSPWGPAGGTNLMAKSPDGKLMFTAAFFDWPDSAIQLHSTDSLLDSGRNGMIKTLHGTLTRETRIEKEGYPGREAMGDIPSLGIIWGRLFLVGERYYQISVIAPPDKIASPEIQRFFDSFSFDKPQ